MDRVMKKILRFFPVVDTIKNYKKEYIGRDLIASLTVAVVAIPQSMAYAIIAGVEPVYGLYAAIISAILGSAFGSSDHLVTGPTNAICLLIASTMKNYMGLSSAYEMLFLLTFVVGVIQLLFGIMRLGKAVNYVSHSVMVGFTGGAGILIALGQLNQFMGITIQNSSQMATTQKLYYVVTHLSQTNLYALGVGVVTIIIIIACKLINKNLPGSLIGIIIPTIIITIFALDQFGIKLTGNMPSSLPPFKMVHFSLDGFRSVLSGSVAIAIIGLVEAISISKSIASTSKQKIDANQEFIGQGITNIVSSFFQCFASSGSFTRSAINFYSGAKTRLAAMFSGVIIAVVLIFFSPYARYIPMPCLAGVIIMIGYGMLDRKEMKKISKAGRTDSIAMWITFAATILMPDLDWAIYLGVAISIVLYLNHTNKAPVKVLLPARNDASRFVERDVDSVKDQADVLIIRLAGNLYFGSASDLEAKLNALTGKAKVYVLLMRRIITIDVTSLGAITNFVSDVKAAGGDVILCGVGSGLNKALMCSNLLSDVGANNVFISEEDFYTYSSKVLERAHAILQSN